MAKELKIFLDRTSKEYLFNLEGILINSKAYIKNYEDDDQFANEYVAIIIAENEIGLQNFLTEQKIRFEYC